MVKLSIVIPAFNVEKWISRCLDSCLNQNLSYDLYELIIVNDGSTDDTIKIIKEYSDSYSNVKIITKKNGGLSSARNAGLGLANGEYVLFLDSDDWISESSLTALIDLFDDSPDVISIGYKLVYDNHTKTVLPYCNNGKELLESHNYPMGAPFWILKRDFINKYNLRFKEGIFHEDNEFTPRVLYLASSIKLLKLPLYNYFIQNEGSIISSKNIKKSYDLLNIVTSYKGFVDQFVAEKDEFIFRELSLLAFNACCANAKNCMPEERQALYRSIILDSNLKEYLFSYSGYKRPKYICEAFVGRNLSDLFLKYMIL
jgi:glycosyltransferase involved in cell wall biosynthesis